MNGILKKFVDLTNLKFIPKILKIQIGFRLKPYVIFEFWIEWAKAAFLLMALN